MSKYSLFIFVLILACESKKEYLIQVPEKTRITSEYILTELEERAKEEPENEWLLNQQLYFCEQLGWPDRCERPLRRAKEKFGLSERLIDRFVVFYLQQRSYDELALILKGTMETRSRLEALIEISLHQDSMDFTYLNRYLARNNDARAYQIAIQSYLLINDSASANTQIKKLVDLDPFNQLLTDVYPVLLRYDEYEKALQVINYGRTQDTSDVQLALDQGKAYYYMGEVDTAMRLMRRINHDEAYLTLHNWYWDMPNNDSALVYLKKISDYSTNFFLQMSHAELLENKGFISMALPFYESALALDSTNVQLQNRVEIVRRKVAYLRKKREEQALPTPPQFERKNLGN